MSAPVITGPHYALPGQTITFKASGGSGSGYLWTLSSNNSGGSIDRLTGVYSAGSTNAVIDRVTLTDSLSAFSTQDVNVTTNAGAFGTGQFGLSPWGGVGSQISLLNAYALGATLVRVSLSGTPAMTGPTIAGDALNPNSWAVRNLETGTSCVVIGVAIVSRQQPITFDLALLRALGNAHVQHEVNAANVLSSQGVPCLPPSAALFAGVLASRQTYQEAGPLFMRQATQDLLNQQAFAGSTVAAGTLQVGPQGDYFNVSGAALTKKLIARRLSTPTGGFFFLPRYGIGLQPKALIRSSDYAQLQKQSQQQVQQEPDVVSAQVNLIVDPKNQILYASVQANITGGQTFQTQQQVGTVTGVQL